MLLLWFVLYEKMSVQCAVVYYHKKKKNTNSVFDVWYFYRCWEKGKETTAVNWVRVVKEITANIQLI
jgi:hypothetical protein